MKFLFLLLLLFSTTWAELTPIENYDFYDVDSIELIAGSKARPYHGGVLPIDTAGTYYLITTIPRFKSTQYLQLSPSPYAVRLFFNGEMVYQWGDGNDIPCLADYRSEVVPLPDYLQADSGDNILLVEFQSDGARISFPHVSYGAFEEVTKKSFWITFLNLDMIQIIVGIGLYSTLFLLIFSILVKGDERILFFALFCLSLVATFSMFPLNSYHFDQVLLFKIGRIGGVMMSLTMFLFITSITSLLNKFTYRLIVVAAFVPYVMFILDGSTKHNINTVFNAASHTLIFPLLIVGLIMLIISMVQKFRVEVTVLLVPYLILMGAVFSDMGYSIQFRQPLFWKIPYGYLAMVAGGMFVILYTRTRLSGQYKVTSDRFKDALDVLKRENEKSENILRGFLAEFSSISHSADLSFTRLDEMITAIKGREELEYLYSTFLTFHISSHNLIYLDKIKQGELYLWYDGFSLMNMLERRLNSLKWISEEKGVELKIAARKRTFPPLVWGDQVAVFQVLANAILCSTEIEKELLQVDMRYIAYEGLEIVIGGNEELFAEKVISLLSSGELNGVLSPIALVFKELVVRLDCTVTRSDDQSDYSSVVILIPLKLSEN